jgi:hypothetical protein
MDISNSKATFGLAALGTPVSTAATGTVQIGSYQQSVNLSEVDVFYAVRAIAADSSADFVLNTATGSTSGSTTFVAGTAQVETATCAGTVSTAGNAKLTITAAGMTGSPLDILFAVALSDTATLWTAKAKTALEANAVVSALFTIGGTSTSISLTRKPTATFTVPGGTLPLYAANDATLNIAIANDTSVGITAAATSTNTTAGAVTSGVKIYDGDGNDAEGVALPASTKIRGIRIDNTYLTSNSDSIVVTSTAGDDFKVSAGEIHQRVNTQNVTLPQIDTLTISPTTGPSDVTVIVAGVQ